MSNQELNVTVNGKRLLTGRRIITSDAERITSANVVSILNTALKTHAVNKYDIEYLYKYYKGDQPILLRTKEVRSEICNKIVVNRANEITTFHVAYLMGEAVQYISRGELNPNLDELNDYMFIEDKACKDRELAEWFTICGTAYRMILPTVDGSEDVSPFEIFTLDPRYTFVVYQNGLGNKPLMGVKYVVREEDNVPVYSVYTEDCYYEIVNDSITRNEPHALRGIPIIEYPRNNARLGAFEVVIPLLDSINTLRSNQVDGVEQFIQALMIFKNVDIDSEDFMKLKELGAIKIPEDADVKMLSDELNQVQTETLVTSIYNNVLQICGMPSQGDGTTSDSSNNGAVILRNGWQSAEARAKDTELNFKKSEKQFLKIAIYLCNELRASDLKLSQIEIRFTRRNYENIQEKANVLASLLKQSKVHPKLAFEHSGLFTDPDRAYELSEQYYQEEMANELKATLLDIKNNGEEDKGNLNDEPQ